MAGVKLSREAARRMADATMTVERMLQGQPAPTKRKSGAAYIGFYARITDRESDGPKCSWVKLEAKPDGTFEDNEDWGKGDHADEWGWAVDINGCENVVKQSIVWLEPAMGQDFYVFCYAPGVLVVKSIDPIESEEEGEVKVELPDDEEDEIKVHNPYGDTVPAESDDEEEEEEPEEVTLVVGYEALKGRWVIVSEDCSDPEEEEEEGRV